MAHKVESVLESPNDIWFVKYKAVTDGLFRKIFALFLTGGAGAFMWKAAFVKGDPSQVMLIAVGFITGSVLSPLIQFFFGTSQSSQDKEKKGGIK